MTPADAAILVVAWLAAIASMRRSLRGRRSMLPSGVLLWAVACTLMLAPIYNWIDPLLGGINATNLIYRLLTIAALGCLDIMILRATRGRDSVAERIVAFIAVTAGALQTVLFAANHWPIVDTYLAAYGGEIGRELFYNVMPLCVGAFAVHVIMTVGSEWRAHSVRATRWGLAMIGLASFVYLLWVAEGIAASALRMWVEPTLLLSGGVDGIASFLMATMVVCTGLGVAMASAEPLVDSIWMRVLLVRATPIWHRVIQAAPELSLTGSGGLLRSLLTYDCEHVLYRRWVEILDCERAKVFIPTSRERALLDSIGAALGGPTSADRERAAEGLSGLLSMGR